jgi:hypothetical protein
MGAWQLSSQARGTVATSKATRNGFIAIGLPLAYYAIIVGSPKALALQPESGDV